MKAARRELRVWLSSGGLGGDVVTRDGNILDCIRSEGVRTFRLHEQGKKNGSSQQLCSIVGSITFRKKS